MAVPVYPPSPTDPEDRLVAEMKNLDAAFQAHALSSYDYFKQKDDYAAELFKIRQMKRMQSVQIANLSYQQIQTQMLGQQAATLNQYASHGMAGIAKFMPRAPLIIEDAFGEVLAWRVWSAESPPYLTSTYKRDFVWLPGKVEEAVGVEDYNNHGFHAWKDERGAAHYAMTGNAPCVVGRVKLWGTIIHHETGYRAQFAKIVSLNTFCSNQDNAVFLRIREHYGLTNAEGAK